MTEKKFKILIADDHKLFSEGLASMVKQLEYIELTGFASNGQEALDLLILHAVDLVITDLHMPGMDGLELIRNVKHQYPNIKILVISMHDEPSVIEEVFDANAEGYILKDATREEFLKAIDRILDDGTYYSNTVLENLLRRTREKKKPSEKKIHLSEREIEILSLIMQEYSSEEIAKKLFLSKRTVDTHRKNILQKTQCRTLVGLIKFAYENGIVGNT